MARRKTGDAPRAATRKNRAIDEASIVRIPRRQSRTKSRMTRRTTEATRSAAQMTGRKTAETSMAIAGMNMHDTVGTPRAGGEATRATVHMNRKKTYKAPKEAARMTRYKSNESTGVTVPITRNKTDKVPRAAVRKTKFKKDKTTKIATQMNRSKTDDVPRATVRTTRVKKNETTKTATRMTRSKTYNMPNATVRKTRVKKDETTKTATRMTRRKTDKVPKAKVRKISFTKDNTTKSATRINRSKSSSAPEIASGVRNPVAVVDHSNITAYDVAHVSVYYFSDEHMFINITGSAPVSANRILLADQFNNKVKLVDTCTQGLLSELHLQSAPWDIAVINTNQAVVTLPRNQKILLLGVTDTLTLQSEIPVGGECRGVAHSKDRLIVTFVDSPRVEIIDLHGILIRRLENASDGSKLFKMPKYVCVSNDSEVIYVSDNSRDTVTSLTFDGEVKSVYKDEQLSGPRKVCTDRHGNVYVCGFGSDNVHMITADCRKIKLILTRANTGNMYSMSHCQHTNRLFISGKLTQMLKIFQLYGVSLY